MNNFNTLTLTVSNKLLVMFFQLLEQGFIMESSVGCSARDFICGQLGMERQYLEERVQTIFLDHNPVDNLDSAVIREESILALSAAMPGLAGATLRKGGRFAALRNQISYESGAACGPGQKTKVTVKLFNVVAKELGEILFQRGIRIKSSNFVWLVEKHIDGRRAHIKSTVLDGKTIDPQRLVSISWQEELFLKVCKA